jgi:Trk K+ transport system NAD-binding subunit
MARQVVIVGGGAVGTHLAALLLAGGHQVTVIETQQEAIPRLQRE